jgi:hypothetical protein
VAHVANVGDFKLVTLINQLIKFANDTYLVILASSINLQSAKVDNVETWARTNNMTKNCAKMQERIFITS